MTQIKQLLQGSQSPLQYLSFVGILVGQRTLDSSYHGTSDGEACLCVPLWQSLWAEKFLSLQQKFHC